MKIKAILNLGYHEKLEIPDKELEGLDNEQREKVIKDYLDFLLENNHISIGWEEVE